MSTNAIPFTATWPAQSPDNVVPSSSGKLLIDMSELAHLTSLSVRTLRRLDASRDIPGRVAVGRRVLFQTELIREWARAGLPGRDQWAGLLKRNGGR